MFLFQGFPFTVHQSKKTFFLLYIYIDQIKVRFLDGVHGRDTVLDPTHNRSLCHTEMTVPTFPSGRQCSHQYDYFD